MSDFMPRKGYLQGIFMHYFIQKNSAAEAYRIFVETDSNHALPETTCKDWFRHCKNNDFDLEDNAILHEDSCQAPAEFAESLEVDHTSFKMFESIRYNSKARTLSIICVEAKRHQTVSCHM